MIGEEVLARAEALEAEGQYEAAFEQMALLRSSEMVSLQ